MHRSWMSHWPFSGWRPEANLEGQQLHTSASNSFRKLGVRAGDRVYVVSLSDGQLYLGGRLTVGRIVSRNQAKRLLRRTDLYPADEWIVDTSESGTPLNLHRKLSAGLARKLHLKTPSGAKQLAFASATRLYSQASRGVREITAESAALFDRILEATDRLPIGDDTLKVTEEMLTAEAATPHERLLESAEPKNGAAYTNGYGYEHDAEAKRQCLRVHGTTCSICEFDFGAAYGPEAEGFIQVHHIRPPTEIPGRYVLNPVLDLIPVCPNCHAVLHLGGGHRAVDEVSRMLVAQRHATVGAAK